MMRRMAREFATNEIAPFAQQWDKEDTYPERNGQENVRTRIDDSCVPAEYGGAGLTM
jgi:butyryl-CoA dehydrogenase